MHLIFPITNQMRTKPRKEMAIVVYQRLVERSCSRRWKLSSGNLYTFIRPNSIGPCMAGIENAAALYDSGAAL